MKKNLIINVIFLLILSTTSFAQESIETQIRNIRTEYALIHNNLNNLTLSECSSNDPSGNFKVYSNDNGNALLIFESKKTTDFYKIQIHFKNENLFFIFLEETKNGIQIQERIYFNENEIIRALIKTKKAIDTRQFSDIPNSPHPDIKVGSEDSFTSLKKYVSKLRNDFKSITDKTSSLGSNIELIEKEYHKIDSELATYTKKQATYHHEQKDGEMVIYSYSLNYTGYFNAKGELVLLTYSDSDEGYYSEYSYYFKDGNEFFLIKKNDFEREDELSINHYYMNKGKGFLAKIKKKTYEDETPFNQIEFTIDSNNQFYYCGRGEENKKHFLNSLK